MKNLTKYKRQYIGITKNGKKIMHVNFFCETDGDEWKKERIFVMDGGDCYFELDYDPIKRKYSALSINGEA